MIVYVVVSEGGDVEVLAHALLELPADAESDYLAVVEALRPHVTDSVFQRLCEALEVCPVHVCDERICADDRDQSCPIGRAA